MVLKNTRAAATLPPEAIRALELQSIGNTVDAEAHFRNAMSKYPRDARVLYALGAMLIQEKRLEEAEAILHKAVTVQPSHAESWHTLGVILVGARRVKEALSCFEKAVKIRPDFTEALTGIGEAMIMQTKWREAERRFVAALKIRPDYTRARHGLARALLEMNRLHDPAQRANIIKALERKGIDSGRIVFMVATPGWREHMAVYDQIDLTLDPMPFNGCTTAFEALWMGVPMITLEGSWMGGRVGMAMLKALGHPEWVAETEEEYIAKAVALAENVDLRRALRVPQREKMRASPLCDYSGVARALEDAFRHMHGRA